MEKRKNISKEQMLQRSEDKCCGLFNSIRDSIVVADTNRNITDCNPAFTSLFGYTLDDIRGKETKFIYYKEEEFIELGKSLNEHFGDSSFVKIVNYKKKSGEIFPGETNVFYLKDKNGEVVGLVGLIVDVSSKRKAEEEIKNKENLFKTIVESAGDAMFLADFKTTQITLVNEQACRSLGYTRKELLAKKVSDLDPLFIEQNHKTNIWQSMTPGETQTVEVMHRRKDGSTFPVEVRTGVFFDNGKKTILGFARDISERKEANRILQESEARFRQLYERSPVPYQSLDIEGNILQVNNVWLEQLGYQNDEVVGRNITEFLVYEDIKLFKKRFLKFVKTGEFPNAEFNCVTKTGKVVTYEAEGRIEYDLQGSFLQTHCMLHNITQRKQAEKKLKASEELFRSLFEYSPLGKLLIDVDGTLNINRSFSEMLGYSAEELKSKHWKEITHPDDIKLSNDVEKSLLSGKVSRVQFEKRYIHKNGDVIWTDIVASIRRDKDNNPEYFLTSVRDITKKKEADILLRENEKRLLSIYQTVGDVLFYIDVESDGNYRFNSVNPSFYRVTGLTEDQVVGKPVNDVIPEPSLSLALEKYKYAIDNRTMTWWEETTDYTTGVRIGHVNIVPIFNADDVCTHIVGSIHDITELEQAAMKIKESEERYDMAMKATSDGVYDWNLITNEIYFSPGWKSMLGYNDAELPNELSVWETKILPEDAKRAWEMQSEVINKKRDRFELEFKMLHKDGHWVDILSRADIIFDKTGKAIRMIGTHHDISEQKRAEEELKFTQASVDNLPDAVYWVTADASLIYVNDAAVRAVGYSKNEMLAMKVYDFSPEMTKEMWSSHWTELKENKYLIFQTKHERKGGSLFPVEITANLIQYGNREINCAIAKDITERYKADELLKESEGKFRKTFMASPDSVNINRLDDGMYIEINNGFTKITGYTKSDVVGKTSLELNIWKNEADRNKLVIGLKKNGFVNNLEAQFLTKNGVTLEGLMSATVIDLKGKPHILSITRDITQRKHAEKELKESNNKYYKLSLLKNAILESPVGIIVFALDKNYCYIDFTLLHKQTMKEIWDVDIAVGINILDIISVEHDRNKANINFDKALAGENFMLLEEYGHEELKRTFYENRYSPIVDENNVIIGLSVFVLDVTDRVKGEKELKKYHNQLEDIVAERTREIDEKNKKLSEQMNMFVGRELKIRDLENKIKVLRSL